jgi:hypothetical protein
MLPENLDSINNWRFSSSANKLLPPEAESLYPTAFKDLKILTGKNM